MSGYTIPLLVSGIPAVEAAVQAIQSLDSKTNSFATNQVNASNRIAEAAKKAEKAIRDETAAIAKANATNRRAAKAEAPEGGTVRQAKLPAGQTAYLELIKQTTRALKTFEGFTKLEQAYKDGKVAVKRYREELDQAASADRILLNGKRALTAAIEKEAIANQNIKAAFAAVNAEQFKETRLLQLQYAEMEKAATATERRTAAVVKLRNELGYAKSLEGRIAEQLKYEIRLAQEDAVAKDKRKASLTGLRSEYEYAISLEGRLAEKIKFGVKSAREDAVATDKRKASLAQLRTELEYAGSAEGKLAEQLKFRTKLERDAATAADKRAVSQERLNQLRTGGPAAEEARLAYQIKLASELAVADLKLIAAKERLAALQNPASAGSESARIARQTAETQKLTAAKERLASLRDPTSPASQTASLDAQIKAQQDLLRLKAAASVSPGERQEIARLTELEKLERERARLLARSTGAFRTLEAEIRRLRAAEESAIAPTKSLSMHLNLANQGAAALRSTIYGMGASFGVFTSSTVLVAAGVYAVSRAFREGIVSALGYEQRLAALGAMASRSSSLAPEYAADKEQLNQAAMSASLSSKYSTLEVTDAMKQLALAGLDVDQTIKATIPTMRLATVGQLGFAEAADISTNVMMGFGMHVEQLPKIIDVLAKAATESNTDVTQLGNAMSYAAPIANSFGVSLEYTAAMMEVLANAGIKSSRAGTGVRRVLVSLFTPTQKITEAVEGFGISLGKVAKEGESLESLDFSIGKFIGDAGGAKEAQRMLEEFYIATAGGTKNLQLLRDAVGVYALPAMTQLVKSVGMGTKSIQAFADELEGIEGTAEQQSAKMLDNLKDIWSQVTAAGDVLSAKLYDEEKSGLRDMLENLLAITRSLAQSSKVAAPFTSAIKALGEAVLRVVAILVSLKLSWMVFSTGALLLSKVTVAVRALGTGLEFLKSRYTAVGSAAAAAAASQAAAASAAGTIGAAGAAAGGTGLLASLGLTGGGLAAGLGIIVAIGAALVYVYKQFSGIGEAVDAVSDAYRVMKEESDAYNQNLQQTYDRLAGGDLVKMYNDRAKLEHDMLDTSGKTVEETKRLRDAYAEVNKEIDGAHKTLREFSSTTMILANARMKDAADAEREKTAEAAKELRRLEEQLKSRQRIEEQNKQRLPWQGKSPDQMYGGAAVDSYNTYATEQAIKAQRGILFLSEQQTKAYEAQYEAAEKVRKVLSQGTALDHARELGVINAGLNQQIKEQIALVENLQQKHLASPKDMGLRDQYQAAADTLTAYKKAQQAVIEQERLAQATAAAGAVTFEKVSAQIETARQKHLDKLKLINGTEQQRAAAVLASAAAEKTAAEASVRQLENTLSALQRLQAAEKDPVVLAAYHQAQINLASDLGAGYGGRTAAQEAYNTALKSQESLTNKAADANNRLIKSAAELHLIKQALIKDIADFKRSFSELNEDILSKGTEVFADMAKGARDLSGALKEVTLSGAEVAGLTMPTAGTQVAGKYSDLINTKGTQYGVDPELIRRVIKQESSFNPNAVSPKGATGLMQLMPATGLQYGVQPGDRTNPEKNVDAGTRYLRDLLKMFGGDVKSAVAGYNAGEGAVQKYKGVPPYKETQNYVAKVTEGYGGTTSAEQVLANTSASKSITILVRDNEALTRAQAEETASAQAQYDAKAHLAQLMQAEESTYAAAKDSYVEAAYWQAQIAANGKLNETQTAAAGVAMERANATWKAYNAAREASLTHEERSIRNGELQVITVKRTSEELSKLREQYVDGDAAMKDYAYSVALITMAMETINPATGKMVLSLKEGNKALAEAKQNANAAVSEYAAFFETLNYGEKELSKIGAGIQTNLRDTLAEAFTTGKMNFEKFLTYLRDAAAKFTADKVIQGLFQPANKATGTSGGLLSGAVSAIGSLASKGIMGLLGFASGGTFSSSLPYGVYSSPTLFPMSTMGHHAFASGTGLLGEAGPEAVLPLTRGSNGRLGVQSNGGTAQQDLKPPIINIVVNTRPGDTAKSTQNGNTLTIDVIEQTLASRVSSGGTALSRSIEMAYGTRRT